MKSLHVTVMVAAMIVLFYGDAYAYLDPASGSYIFQLVLAGLLGAALVVKTFWRGLKSYFSGLLKRRHDREPDRIEPPQ